MCFDYGWESGATLDAIIATLYWLLENPNFDDPLTSTVEQGDYPERLREDIIERFPPTDPPTEEEIRLLAYTIYLETGKDDADANYYEAERRLRH